MAKAKGNGGTLKKITTRAKALKKKHPGKKWTTLVKQAGKEFRSGKLGKVRKKRHTRKVHAVKRGKVGVRKHTVKRHTVKRHTARRRKRTAKKMGAKRYKPVKNVTHCRRVGRRRRRRIGDVTDTAPSTPQAKQTNWQKIALIGGGIIVALYAFSRPSTTTLTPAAQAAGGSSILSYATAAGASATALANLVAKLNTSTPAQVQSANLQLAQTSQLPSDWQSVITAGAGPSTSNTQLATQVLTSDE
jgi:hypothetical protein